MTADDMLSPEEALALHPEVELRDDLQVWIDWAARELADEYTQRRCVLEELADTHCVEAAALLLRRPELLDAAIKTVTPEAQTRLQFAGYRARKFLRRGRDVNSLTTQMRAAVRFHTEQAAAKRVAGVALSVCERELVQLVGENWGATWL